ncbi:hypothetical protein AQ912_11660 [Burkholderia pseudomallei]|nr:hypothetical protein AQ912_11660 [Burkholderia pseudomallei]
MPRRHARRTPPPALVAPRGEAAPRARIAVSPYRRAFVSRNSLRDRARVLLDPHRSYAIGTRAAFAPTIDPSENQAPCHTSSRAD